MRTNSLKQPKTILGPILPDTYVYGHYRTPRLSIPSLMDTHRQYLNYQLLKGAGMIDNEDDDDFFKYMIVNNLMTPKFSGGKDGFVSGDELYNVGNVQEIGIVSHPKRTITRPALPADFGISMDEGLTKDYILNDIYTSNASLRDNYLRDMYKQKSKLFKRTGEFDESDYLGWASKKTGFLHNIFGGKTNREKYEQKYRNHVNRLYGSYAQSIADAVNYINGYYNSPQYADRIRGIETNPRLDIQSGKNYLFMYPMNGGPSYNYDSEDNTNSFYIPVDFNLEDTYPGMYYDPYTTMAHEYDHYKMAALRGLPYNTENRENNLFGLRYGAWDDHDSQTIENHADMMATRADMYRRGYLNKSNPYGEITIDLIKDYRKKWGDLNRFFRMYDDENIRSMLNTIAYNPVQNLNMPYIT